jgi:hypothetical protein
LAGKGLRKFPLIYRFMRDSSRGLVVVRSGLTRLRGQYISLDKPLFLSKGNKVKLLLKN